MDVSSTKRRPRVIQVLVVVALMIGFTSVPATAQFGLTRLEGAWDLAEDDPRVINVYKLAAAGHETRSFAVTKISPVGAGRAQAKGQPQFLPVSNVRGDPAMVEEFFNAKPGQMVSVIGRVGGQGASLTLNTVTVRPLGSG